jgi:hypothetical protein
LKGNVEPDPDELDLVFHRSPNYAKVLEQVRNDFNWNEPSDVVELEWRHNVGFGMHIRWKTTRINSEQHWTVYREMVVESQDKALALFTTKRVDNNLQLDLNRRASPIDARSPPPMSQEELTEPPMTQDEPLGKEDDEYDDGENDFEMNDNIVGDLDTYLTQENMDQSIPYSRCYESDSDDDGPDEDLDEDGFTPKEAERAGIFKKLTRRNIRIPLFYDVSLADGSMVDSCKSLLPGARPISHRDGIVKGLTFDTLFGV